MIIKVSRNSRLTTSHLLSNELKSISKFYFMKIVSQCTQVFLNMTTFKSLAKK